MVSAFCDCAWFLLLAHTEFFLEERAASSRSRLTNNRSVIPLFVLDCTHATLKESGVSFLATAPHEQEIPSTSELYASVGYVPAICTHRLSQYRFNDLVRSLDRCAVTKLFI